jgi:hypothetical protein
VSACMHALLVGGYHAAREAAARAGESPRECFFSSDDDMRKAWTFVEAELLAAWVIHSPGTRPASWWRYSDSVSELRRVTGLFTELIGRHRCHETGICYLVPGDPRDPPVVESQAAFLDRLDLWLPGERARVPAEAFAESPFSIGLTWQPEPRGTR